MANDRIEGVEGALALPMPRLRCESWNPRSSFERFSFDIMRCSRLPPLEDLVVGVSETVLTAAGRVGWTSGGGPSSRKEIKSFVAFETGYNGARPRVPWSLGSGLDSLPSSEPFMIASMSIDSRFLCILRFRWGVADGLFGAWCGSRPKIPNDGGLFTVSDGFLVTRRPARLWDIPEVDTDRVRISDGLATERDCPARDDATASLGSSSSMIEST